MAIVCIAGTSAGIGKTAVVEFLLASIPGWHVARVRVADEVAPADAAAMGGDGYRIVSAPAKAADAELGRFLAAGARSAALLVAEPHGLEPGLKALLARFPPDANILVEGNAFLWGRDADACIMVIGPGPSGRGLARVRQSVRELFRKVHIWAWNTRADPNAEGFFEFPMDLAKMGFKETVSNAADYHHVHPRDAGHAGNQPFAEAVLRALERCRWRTGSDEFLRKAGFDI
jgi:hypothetical protein